MKPWFLNSGPWKH